MNLLNVFSIPVWESIVPDFKKNQNNYIDATLGYKERNSDGLLNYNHNGSYQSIHRLQNNDQYSLAFSAASQLGAKASFDCNFIRNDVFVASAWSIINSSPTHYTLERSHRSTFTGVFFVKSPEGTGNLVLNNRAVDPLWHGLKSLGERNKFTSDNVKMKPKEGMMYLWPSYLNYRLESNKHSEESISIFFNLVCLPIDKEKDNEK